MSTVKFTNCLFDNKDNNINNGVVYFCITIVLLFLSLMISFLRRLENFHKNYSEVSHNGQLYYVKKNYLKYYTI